MDSGRALLVGVLAVALAGCGSSLTSIGLSAHSAHANEVPLSPGGDNETVLWTFSGSTDGNTPLSGIIRDAGGSLYGTTRSGGYHPYYPGVIYQLIPNGSNSTEILLHEFSGTDGYWPYAALVFDSKGNLYGTTSGGGNTWNGGVSGPCNGWGCGTVFELNKASGWTEYVLYNFQDGADGGVPRGPVTFDPHGNLYGTTHEGGNVSCTIGAPYGCGTIFKLTPSGNNWIKITIHAFSGTDGAFPASRLAIDAHGNLFGTALGGTGTSCSTDGCGVIFKLSGHGSSWTETVIHDFTGGSDGGMIPTQSQTGLLADTKGNLYGATSAGGKYGDGLVYELTHTGSTWREKVLFNFSSTTAAKNPTGELSFDAHGDLFGSAGGGSDTCPGGRHNAPCGTVYELSPTIKGLWKETDLYSFADNGGGFNPNGGLAINAAGDIFGTTQSTDVGNLSCCGVVFELAP